MGDPHGIAIVGLGVISRAYLETIGRHPGIRIVAVADLDVSRAQAVAAEFGAEALEVAAAVARPGVQTVLNLTIPAAHAQVALTAIAAGRSVYGEKPLTATLDEARQVLDAAADAGVRVGSAPDTVLGTGIQTARAAIDAGRIGRPISATATWYAPGHERWHPNPDFYYQPGGGPLLDMGPYYLTSLVQLLGPVVSVTGAASRTRDSRTIGSGPRAGEVIPVGVETHVTGVLEHEAGALSTITMSFDGVRTVAEPIEVHGELGSLILPDPNGFAGDVRLFRLGDDEWQVLPPSAGFEDGARGVGLLDFVAAAPGEERASGSVALHVLEVMTELLASAKTGTRRPIGSRPERPTLVPLTPAAVWRASS
ncbi:Gfo/Idh/MocA family protein [Naasia lichenicola]|uniref:Gfo/Idh/MocA family oxidoreductase n=1 Tax=Naasia lichenicola TaxID=2565933 RepID=A0A4S4FSM7_9MICO|nr:Gfo/Idh/MocA family oxidoreductase [Naasia lichenicola]THG32912.1 Gfo/Idh/MocA family oxidoreductase [Naasia lichenicola]